MRAVDHYAEAEKALDRSHREPIDDGTAGYYLARAQVHATLALAGATAMQAYSTAQDAELDDWAEAAGGDGS